MKDSRKKLVLLDAHAIIHRAYHAMPDFTTRAGIPTGAIYGFSTMVLRIIDDFNPDYIVACYDLPGKTFRHESYADYKGTRSKTDDALKMQFDATREACSIFSIPIYDAAGFEADDVLGTIVQQLKDDDIDIIIASGDMDTLQLVDKKHVQVFTLKRGLNDTIIYDEKAVIERFHFKPISIIDYKALRGDSSDNIPGIRGVGEKAATLAITEFGTIEKMYKALEKDEDKFLKIGLTKRMIGLIREGKEEAEFSKILATIRLDVPIKFVLPKADWHSSVDIDAALEFFQKYEFRALPARLQKTLGINIEKGEEKKLEQTDKIKEIDLKYTSIALSLLDSDKTDAKVEDILEYTGQDSFISASKQIFDEVKKIEKINLLYENIEKPLFPIVKKMQDNGIKIDIDFFTKLGKKYHTELSKIEKEIFRFSGVQFNIKSPKQLSEILFDEMKLSTKGIKKSKTGTYSTNIQMLEKLLDVHPVIKKIIEYRELQKLLSTYIDVIPKMVGDDGRLHAEFLQNGTSTGRFSSRNPNLQNIPTRTDLGRKIREGFITESGKTFVSLDYSQIELRILAILSGDENLIQIFKDGRDIHTAVASKIANIPEIDVDRVIRNKAKVVNFGILYGMGVNSLKKNMNTTQEEAQMFYNGFFEQFGKATAFLEATKQYARDNSYTETLFGRRRQFKSINAKLPFIRAMAERMALNAPIQGTNADIIKLAMVSVDNYINNNKSSAKLILQIHDEIVYEIDENEAEKFSTDVTEIMGKILGNSYLKYETEVPIIVHSSSGKHWGELK